MIYKLELTLQEMKVLGFRYDRELNDYTYNFAVYRSNGRATLYAKIGVDEDNNRVWWNVYDNDGKLYTPYYNRNFGKSDVVDSVDDSISKELLRLGAVESE